MAFIDGSGFLHMGPPETATLTSRTCEKPLLCKDLQIMHMNKMWGFRCAYMANSLVNTRPAHGGIVGCVSGAVALHAFAEMIRCHYDVAPELTVVDSVPSSIAVSTVLKSLERPLVAGVSPL
jgi:hypothetical protein